MRSTQSHGHSSRWQYNRRLLFLTISVVAGVSVGAGCLYQIQNRRHGKTLLARADELEIEKSWDKAAQYLERYTKLRPDDTTAQVRFAEVFDRAARSHSDKAKAAVLFASATIASDRVEVQRRYVEILLELGNSQAAKEQALDLLRKHPGDAKGLRLFAFSLASHPEITKPAAAAEVVKAFEAALKQNPHDVELGTRLASFYRTRSAQVAFSDALARGLAVFDGLIEKNPKSADLYLARYYYRLGHHLEGADGDLEKALEFDSKKQNISVQLTAGERAASASRNTEAMTYFKNSIAADPDDRRGYLELGLLHRKQGNLADAIAVWELGLKIDRKDLYLRMQIVEAALQLKQVDKTKQMLDEIEVDLAALSSATDERIRMQFHSCLELLRGHQAIARRQFATAAKHFRRNITLRTSNGTSKSDPQFDSNAYIGLGTAYAGMREWDRAAWAFENVCRLNPTASEPRWAAAQAWLAAGRVDEAVSQLAKVAQEQELSAEAWATYCSALFQQQMCRPATERRWDFFQETLQRARKTAPDFVQLIHLAAEFEAARGEFEQGMELLRSSAGTNTDSARLEHLVLFCERWGHPDGADRALAELIKSDDPPPRVLLLQATLLARRGQFDAAQKMLTTAIARSPEQDMLIRSRLHRSALYLAAGQSTMARDELNAIAKTVPGELSVHEKLAELAVGAHDWDEVELRERQIEQIEGSEGTTWRFFQATRLIEQAKDGNAPGLKSASQLVKEIQQLRPNWDRAAVLKARLEIRRGRLDEAIAAYQQAVQFGKQSITVAGPLIQLLFAQNRLAEANEQLAQLKRFTALSPQLNDLDIAIDLRHGDIKQALAAARESVASRPNDPDALGWLGESLFLNDQPAAAEQAFVRATEIAPQSARTWSGLLSFSVRTENSSLAREALKGLNHHAEIPSTDRPFVLAQAHEMIGDRAAAEAMYRLAFLKQVENPAVWNRAGHFFYPSDPKTAEKCFRRAVELDANLLGARRMLAVILAGQESKSARTEVWKLLEEGGNDGRVDFTSLQLKASLLARYGGIENRQEAAKILEKLVRDPQSDVENERMLLASVYEASSQARAARDQLVALASKTNPSPEHLAAYVDYLIRYDKAEEAHEWLERLEAREPRNESLRTLRLNCRWLSGQGRAAEAPPLIQAYLDAQLTRTTEGDAKVQLLQNVAVMFDLVGQNDLAETYYRLAADAGPQAYRTLAVWLAARGRAVEAIPLCMQHAATDETSLSAITLTAVLALDQSATDDLLAADVVLTKAIDRHPRDVRLLTAVATLRQLQGRNNEAIQFYRQGLELDPKNLMAMNNLALTLAMRNETAHEAIETIEKAIHLGGNRPEFLDTKGWILINQREFAKAVVVLREATAVPPGDPRHLFHLALALWGQHEEDEAQATLEKARRQKLSLKILSGAERKQLMFLEKELGDF